MLTILTTYVRSNPPQVEDALKLIKARRGNIKLFHFSFSKKRIEKEISGKEENTISAEKALKYVCWLVDVDKLYDIALGMYDFPLVMMVAQKSQKVKIKLFSI